MLVDDTLLARAVQRAAVELPSSQLEKLAAVLDAHDTPTALARHAIVNVVPTAVFRNLAANVAKAWSEAPTPLPGCAVALAVRSAASAVDEIRGEERVEVVWTGPSTYEVPVRATSAVVEDLIGEARRDLLIVSFAAYKIRAIITALQAAAAREVTIRLVLESAIESKGKLSQDAKAAFDALGNTVSFYVWPADRRAEGGAMHVKCAVADRRTAFVTSANLTGAAMTQNMELGIVIEGGDAPRRIRNHFETLINAGTLREL